MLYSGTDPVSYITEYTLVNEEKSIASYASVYMKSPIWRARALSRSPAMTDLYRKS